MIYLGADHAGFNLKEKLKKDFIKNKIKFFDLGNDKMDKEDDYPDYAFSVANKVSQSKKDFGILLCANAIGVSIAANKVKNVRAGIGYSAYAAKSGREDDHLNILCLPAKVLKEQEAFKIIKTWLKATPSKATRHLRRLKKIADFEDKK